MTGPALGTARQAASAGSAGIAGIAGIAAVFALALCARSIGYEFVFLDDGSVVYAAGDAWYHMRRALWSFAHFPSYLTFDRCLNHPSGSPVPWPPLWDLTLAAAGHLAGGTRSSFERAAAWLPAIVGALAVLPVFALGRRFAGIGVGLGAAGLYAVLPAAVEFARVGNPDHHAAVALLGACLLSLYAAGLDARTRGGTLIRVAMGLAVVRGAMLLVWPGTLLYLAPGELALALSGILLDRRDRLLAVAASAAGSLILVLPAVLNAATPLAGPFSATEISWLHVAALAAEVAVLCVAAGVARARPDARPALRLAVAAGSAALLAAVALAVVPGLAAGIAGALSFLSGTDAIGGANLELLPLLKLQNQSPLAAGARWLGLFLLLAPVVPLAFLALREHADLRGPALLLFVWTLLFAVLASEQIRYMNDYAPAACVGFALTLELSRRWLAKRMPGPVAATIVLAAGVALLAPAVLLYHVPYLNRDLMAAKGAFAGTDRALFTVAGSQMRFAQAVRAVTPESPGCGVAPGVPDYGILAHPAIGHSLHYTAERATPADPFGPYIGPESYEKVKRFFLSTSEEEALALSRELGTRYVVTTEDVSPAPGSLLDRLHVGNGGSADGPSWGHFRLLEEGPKGGLSLTGEFSADPLSRVPYKLYEVVTGAILEVPAAPGHGVRALVTIETPVRRFAFEAAAVAGDDGIARLRVPYATGSTGAVRASGPYRVTADGKQLVADVGEDAVRAGTVVRVRAGS